MLTAQQAEGALGGTGNGDGSVLEEFLDFLVILPVEIRRCIILLRELDSKSEKELKKIKICQDALLQEARSRVAKCANTSEKSHAMKQLRETPLFKELSNLRASISQNIAEKNSLASQLVDIGEINIKRLDGDIKYVQDLCRNSGEILDLNLAKGRFVAAWMEDDGVWILAKVAEHLVSEPNKVVVTDAEDDTSTFALHISEVTVLPEKESLQEAKVRLPTRGCKVYAMYPDTTSFYEGTLVGLPNKDSNGGGTDGNIIGHTATAYQKVANSSLVVDPSISVLCQVLFDDDADDATGQTAKHNIPSRFVFPAD